MTEHIGTNWAWVIPALSAGAFFVVLPFRRCLPKGGAYLSIAAILGGFVLFWFVLLGFLDSGAYGSSVRWLSVGATKLTWGVHVDEISVTMLGLVTFVALLVQVYSLGYMRHDGHDDPGLGRYYAFHSLFAAAMLALVLADNLVFLYIAWELVGLGSYLLIGFWYERRSAAEAAKKAFVTTRIGDVGLLIGIILLFNATGTFEISTIIHIAQNGGIPDGTLNAAMFLIFLGAMGKSAQVPFHVWLPDAMEGPTPVSALIHAATMVAAGVYLVARLMPMFELAPVVLVTIASVGLFTFLFAGTIALVVTDIKRVLAYSTISHLGLMMLSLGAGGVGAALFHLVAHGVSKALLFLGAGSVMHATGRRDRHPQDGRSQTPNAADGVDLRHRRGVSRRGRAASRFLHKGRGAAARTGTPPPRVHRACAGWRGAERAVHRARDVRHLLRSAEVRPFERARVSGVNDTSDCSACCVRRDGRDARIRNRRRFWRIRCVHRGTR